MTSIPDNPAPFLDEAIAIGACVREDELRRLAVDALRAKELERQRARREAAKKGGRKA